MTILHFCHFTLLLSNSYFVLRLRFSALGSRPRCVMSDSHHLDHATLGSIPSSSYCNTL